VRVGLRGVHAQDWGFRVQWFIEADKSLRTLDREPQPQNIDGECSASARSRRAAIHGGQVFSQAPAPESRETCRGDKSCTAQCPHCEAGREAVRAAELSLEFSVEE